MDQINLKKNFKISQKQYEIYLKKFNLYLYNIQIQNFFINKLKINFYKQYSYNDFKC